MIAATSPVRPSLIEFSWPRRRTNLHRGPERRSAHLHPADHRSQSLRIDTHTRSSHRRPRGVKRRPLTRPVPIAGHHDRPTLRCLRKVLGQLDLVVDHPLRAQLAAGDQTDHLLPKERRIRRGRRRRTRDDQQCPDAESGKRAPRLTGIPGLRAPRWAKTAGAPASRRCVHKDRRWSVPVRHRNRCSPGASSPRDPWFG